MKRWKYKLKQQKGETLIEALVSMLICTLAIGLLVTSILVATRINAANAEADAKFYKDLNRAETYLEEEGYEKTTINITITSDSIGFETKEVTLYGGEDGTFVAYDYEAEVADDE